MALLINHLLVAHCRQGLRVPVHHTCTAVDQPLVVEVNKNADDALVAHLVHRERRAVPVAAGAQLAKLLQNDATVFLLPLPGVFQKFVAAQAALVDALFGEHLHHLGLGRDAGVVRSRHPAGILAHHSRAAHQHILNRVVQHMAHMQHTRHVGRRNHHRIGLPMVGLGMKQFLLQPEFIPLFLYSTRIIFRSNFHLYILLYFDYNKLSNNSIHHTNPQKAPMVQTAKIRFFFEIVQLFTTNTALCMCHHHFDSASIQCYRTKNLNFIL